MLFCNFSFASSSFRAKEKNMKNSNFPSEKKSSIDFSSINFFLKNFISQIFSIKTPFNPLIEIKILNLIYFKLFNPKTTSNTLLSFIKPKSRRNHQLPSLFCLKIHLNESDWHNTKFQREIRN